MGRAPIKGSKPFLPRCLRNLSVKGHFDLLLGQLGFQLQQELVDHPQDHHLVQSLEADDCIQAVTELRREQSA